MTQRDISAARQAGYTAYTVTSMPKPIFQPIPPFLNERDETELKNQKTICKLITLGLETDRFGLENRKRLVNILLKNIDFVDRSLPDSSFRDKSANKPSSETSV